MMLYPPATLVNDDILLVNRIPMLYITHTEHALLRCRYKITEMENSARRIYRRQKRRFACKYCSARHIRCKTAEPLLRNVKAKASVGSCQACIAANSPCDLAIASRSNSATSKICSDEGRSEKRRRRYRDQGRFSASKPHLQVPCVEVEGTAKKTQRDRHDDSLEDQICWNIDACERSLPEELSYNENECDPERKLSSAVLCLNLKYVAKMVVQHRLTYELTRLQSVQDNAQKTVYS